MYLSMPMATRNPSPHLGRVTTSPWRKRSHRPARLSAMRRFSAAPWCRPMVPARRRTGLASPKFLIGWRVYSELRIGRRSEEHTSELQSRGHLVCRLLLEKKKEHDTTY